MTKLRRIALGMGLRVKEVEADGDCFYHAMAENLNEINGRDDITAAYIKPLTIKWLRENRMFTFAPDGVVFSPFAEMYTHAQWEVL